MTLRRIRTVEDLIALPVDSVVLTEHGWPLHKTTMDGYIPETGRTEFMWDCGGRWVWDHEVADVYLRDGKGLLLIWDGATDLDAAFATATDTATDIALNTAEETS